MEEIFCIPEIIRLLYNIFILDFHFGTTNHNSAIHAKKVFSNFLHVQTDADTFMLT